MAGRPQEARSAATGHAAVIRQALPPRNSRQRLDTLTPETQQSRAAHFALDAALREANVKMAADELDAAAEIKLGFSLDLYRKRTR